MKPVIGVMPLWDDEKHSIWMLPGYMNGISEAGGLPIIIPFTSDEEELEQAASMCDGFLFTGGHDVSPELYGEIPMEETVFSCSIRDQLELSMLKLSLESEKPVLGICRGIQFINAALGGTLYQDLPTQHPSSTGHHQSAPYDVPVHTVSLIKETPLYNTLKIDELRVNSYHHQAVKTLSDNLKPMAISSDGLIEALYMPEHRFLWAVQWHPEFSYQKDENSRLIFKTFVNACK